MALFKNLSLLILTLSFGAAGSFASASAPTPEAIVRAFYAPSFDDNNMTADALAMIRQVATAELNRWIDENDKCEIREQGLCNLDFDLLSRHPADGRRK
jgi:hypothetical protein